MRPSRSSWRTRLRSAAIALLTGAAVFTVQAGTLDLAQTPLFLSSGADPNIMLLVDDATSMDFQMAGDVSLLNIGTARYPEVDQGQPIGFQCNFSIAALLNAILTLNVLALTDQVQRLVTCVGATSVEGSNGLLPLPPLPGVLAIVTGLLNNSLELHLLNIPQFHYAYLNDTDDNYFANETGDYTNGFLPVMLEEAYISPTSNVDGIAGPNPNYRPPALSTYNCVTVLGSSCTFLSSWNFSTNAPTRTGAGITTPDDRNACQYPRYSFTGAASNYSGATAPAGIVSPGYWRAWNATYNPIAYNPGVTYEPWKGYDINNSPFTDADPAAVRFDPLDPSKTYDITAVQRHRGTVAYRCNQNMFEALIQGDIGSAATGPGIFKQLVNPPPVTIPAYTGNFPPSNTTQAVQWNAHAIAHNNHGLTWMQLYPARYYSWLDNNGNGIVDAWEAHQLVEIRTDGSCGFGATCPSSFSRPATRTDCPGGTCTAEQELQNYANWFQYYRRRELVAKAAYSEVIADKQGARMGLGVLVKNSNTRVPGPAGLSQNVVPDENPTIVTATPGYKVARKIEPLNNDYTEAGGSKRDLLDHLVRINSGGGGSTTFFGLNKPLRSGLQRVGEYLDCNTNSNPFSFTHNEIGGLATVATSCPLLTTANGGACQQNFTVMVTDGFWDSSDGLNPAVGNADGDRNTTWDGGAYADNRSSTLADVAMHYYERDLATALPNNQPKLPGVDEAPHQHMVTYALAFGLDGALSSNPANPTQPFTWPNPFSSDEAKVDDLRHAAYNGRGDFLTAHDSAGLKTALSRVFSDITVRASSASSVALNSGSLNTGTTVFQARFYSSDFSPDSATAWSGQLLAFPISPGPGFSRPPCVNEPKGEKCPQIWDAGIVLKGQDWNAGRAILTLNGDTKTGVPFRWDSLSTAQQVSLNRDLATNTADALGPDRLEYLRGNKTLEGSAGNQFRVRSSPLGDIINSDPFFVGAPRAPYDLFPGYGSFRTGNLSRTQMVYVGSNDGMLHGFRASDGQELLAYVPGDSHVYGNLPLLTLQDYKSRHAYFVDGSPNVDDVEVNGGWKTILATGLRRGGQSIIAIDVTDPDGFAEASAASLVLWEFSDEDDPDLGYTFGRPTMAKLRNGKWAVMVGNGYNSNESSATDTAVGAGEACLFILYLDGPSGANRSWVAGTDYRKICVNSGGPNNNSLPNGLASPAAVDLNGDNVMDTIYAGDLEGNLWRFDVSSSSDSAWDVAYGGDPLFTACAGNCSNTNRQPITTQPEVGPHPLGAPTANGVLVYFGTGKYIENGDDSATGQPTQTFYSVYDQLWGMASATPATAPALPLQRNSLVPQQILSEQTSAGGNCATDTDCFRVTTTNSVVLTPVGGDPVHHGWYLDLVNTQTGNNQGERVVSDPLLRSDRIVFTTLIPQSDICSFGGSGWLMELAFASGAPLPVSPWDINNDSNININDNVTYNSANVPPSGLRSPIGIIARPTVLAKSSGEECEYKYLSGSDGTIKKICESGDYHTGRLTWRQIR